jgi:hypothetical protein
VAVFTVVLVVRTMLSGEDPRVTEQRRCTIEQQIRVVNEMRAFLKERNPSITQAELERRVTVTHKDVRQEAASRCGVS